MCRKNSPILIKDIPHIPTLSGGNMDLILIKISNKLGISIPHYHYANFTEGPTDQNSSEINVTIFEKEVKLYLFSDDTFYAHEGKKFTNNLE
jgi:hypothetical protein